MTRDDLKAFRALDIDFDSIGLLQSEAEDFAYFCTPADAEYVGRIGCDGVHFILLPGDERVYCVDPAMGEEGKYVLPVAGSFREFLSFVLFLSGCQPALPDLVDDRGAVPESAGGRRCRKLAGERGVFREEGSRSGEDCGGIRRCSHRALREGQGPAGGFQSQCFELFR